MLVSDSSYIWESQIGESYYYYMASCNGNLCIKRVAKDGGSRPEIIVESMSLNRFVMDEERIYYILDGKLYSSSKDGTDSMVLVVDEYVSDVLRQDRDWVYYAF